MMPLPASSTPDRFVSAEFCSFVGFGRRSQLFEQESDRGHFSDRLVEPAETLQTILPFFPRYGITRLARQTGLDRLDIPVWNAIRPNSLSLAVNQGKGITDLDAKVSAAMEAIERAIAGQPEAPSQHICQSELDNAGYRYSLLESLLGRGQRPSNMDDQLDWMEGFDLLQGIRIWVPRDCVTLDRTRPNRYWQSSDGLASGNTPLEALFHGVLERIERDAEILWSFEATRQRQQRLIDPAAFSNIIIDDLLARIKFAGLRLQLFDMTSDLGIPSFTALLGPHGLDPIHAKHTDIANGSGAHIDARRAAIRAITEAAQSRITLIGGSRDDIDDCIYQKPLSASLYEDFTLEPANGRQYDATRCTGTMEDKLNHVIGVLKDAGMSSLIAVPLNEFTCGFSVMKVIIPSLENPPGPRDRQFGARAVARMLRHL